MNSQDIPKDYILAEHSNFPKFDSELPSFTSTSNLWKSKKWSTRSGPNLHTFL